MRKTGTGNLLLGLLAALLGMTAHAQAPSLVNYQGQLLDADGKPLVTGSYRLEFNVYTAESAGTRTWGPKTYATAAVQDGYFNVILDVDSDGDPFSVALDGPDRWLGIKVDNGTELRQQLLSAPYALRADTATRLQGSAWTDYFTSSNPATAKAKDADKLDGRDWSAILESGSDPAAGGARFKSSLMNLPPVSSSIEVGMVIEVYGALVDAVIDPRTLDTTGDGVADLPLAQGRTRTGAVVAGDYQDYVLCVQPPGKGLRLPAVNIDASIGSNLADAYVPDKPLVPASLEGETYKWTKLLPVGATPDASRPGTHGFAIAYDNERKVVWVTGGGAVGQFGKLWREGDSPTYRWDVVSLPDGFTPNQVSGGSLHVFNRTTGPDLLVVGGFYDNTNSRNGFVLELTGTDGPSAGIAATPRYDLTTTGRDGYVPFFDEESATLAEFGGFLRNPDDGLATSVFSDVLVNPSPSPVSKAFVERVAAYSAFNPRTRRGYIFGGHNEAGNHFTDVFEVDMTTRSYTGPRATNGALSARDGGAGTGSGFLHPYTEEFMVLCGDIEASGITNELWKFSPATGNWSEVESFIGGTKPEPRHTIATCVDTDRKTVILYGGRGGGVTYNDVWELSFGGTLRLTGSIMKVK
ncbi:hypothetical protein GC173_07105 [bacterium]|nr:hypothetical protein [bacterium]